MAKRQTTKKPKPVMSADEAHGAYVSATINTYDNFKYLSYSKRDADLVGRAIVQTIYAAAHLNATACTGVPIRLMAPSKGGGKSLWNRRKVTGKAANDYLRRGVGRKAVEFAARAGDVDEVMDHPARTLLVDPDPFTVSSQWLYLLFWFKEVAGRSYIYCGERDQSGEPLSLYHMYPQYTRPNPDKDRFIASYSYGRDSSDMLDVPPQDCMYLRFEIDPQNPTEAMSWVRSVALYGDVENAAISAEIARWSNGGSPGMVLEVDEKTTDTQMQQIEQRILRRVRGVAKAGMPLVLRRAKMVMSGAKPMEMQYVEGARRAEEAIYRAAGVPETIWRMADSNRASAVAGDPQYMGQTIRPRLNCLAEELTELLLPQFGIEPGEMWFVFDNPVAEDRKAEFDECIQLTDRGLMLPNDFLGKMGYPLVPDTLNVYRTTAGAVMQTGESEPQADPAAPEVAPPDPAKLMELADKVASGDLPQSTAEGIAAVSFPMLAPEQVSAIFTPLAGFEKPKSPAPPMLPSGKQDDGDAEDFATSAKSLLYRTRFDDQCHGPTCTHDRKAVTNLPESAPAALEALTNSFAADLTAWYEKAAKRALESAANGGVVGVQPDAELDRIIERGIRSMLLASANEGARAIGQDAFDVLPKSVLGFLEGYRIRLAKDISDDFAAALKGVLSQGVEQGLSYAEMTAELAPVMGDAAGWRAERIARTETSNAYTQGRLAAWNEYGVPKKKWLLSGNPCSICLAVAAKFPDPVPIDTVFIELGETIIGADGTTYTETYQRRLGPPCHPNDACDLLPVEDTE